MTFDNIKIWLHAVSLEVILISMISWLTKTNSLLAVGVSFAGLVVAVLTAIHIWEKIKTARIDRSILELKKREMELELNKKGKVIIKD